MPSGEKAPMPSPASAISDLNPKAVELYWQIVELCLREVFKRPTPAAREAVEKMREETDALPGQEALFVYHDSPLQTASILAGAASRELTDEELLDYDKLWQQHVDDRPSEKQILQVARHELKAG